MFTKVGLPNFFIVFFYIKPARTHAATSACTSGNCKANVLGAFDTIHCILLGCFASKGTSTLHTHSACVHAPVSAWSMRGFMEVYATRSFESSSVSFRGRHSFVRVSSAQTADARSCWKDSRSSDVGMRLKWVQTDRPFEVIHD